MFSCRVLIMSSFSLPTCQIMKLFSVDKSGVPDTWKRVCFTADMTTFKAWLIRMDHIVWNVWLLERVSEKTSDQSRRRVTKWVNEQMRWIIAANVGANSLTSLLTCVSSHSFWLLCVMLCFIWRAIIFPIKYTTCISLTIFFFSWVKFQSEAITLFRQRKFRKITRCNWKENNALSTEMENTENNHLREASDAYWYVKVSRSTGEINSFLP